MYNFLKFTFGSKNISFDSHGLKLRALPLKSLRMEIIMLVSLPQGDEEIYHNAIKSECSISTFARLKRVTTFKSLE